VDEVDPNEDPNAVDGAEAFAVGLPNGAAGLPNGVEDVPRVEALPKAGAPNGLGAADADADVGRTTGAAAAVAGADAEKPKPKAGLAPLPNDGAVVPDPNENPVFLPLPNDGTSGDLNALFSSVLASVSVSVSISISADTSLYSSTSCGCCGTASAMDSTASSLMVHPSPPPTHIPKLSLVTCSKPNKESDPSVALKTRSILPFPSTAADNPVGTENSSSSVMGAVAPFPSCNSQTSHSPFDAETDDDTTPISPVTLHPTSNNPHVSMY
jgi:hypothetical protein